MRTDRFPPLVQIVEHGDDISAPAGPAGSSSPAGNRRPSNNRTLAALPGATAETAEPATAIRAIGGNDRGTVPAGE